MTYVVESFDGEVFKVAALFDGDGKETKDLEKAVTMKVHHHHFHTDYFGPVDGVFIYTVH